MPTNDFLPFAADPAANVLSQADYEALAGRITGFQAGIASSEQFNKAWRQSSVVSSMLAQFISDQLDADVLDDGDLAALQAMFLAAVRSVSAESSQIGQCRLVLDNANLRLSPYNGNKLRINGLLHSIPDAGVALGPAGLLAPVSVSNVAVAANVATITTSAAHGLAAGNTVWVQSNKLGVIDGVVSVVNSAPQFTIPWTTGNLASVADTGSCGQHLFVYAFMNADVMTLEAVPVGYVVDTSGGANDGTFIKSGDPTRTLVGQCRTIAGPAFVDSVTQSFVSSFFNRRTKKLQGASAASFVTSSLTAVELSATCRVEYLLWLDDLICPMNVSGAGSNTVSGDGWICALGVDGAVQFPNASGFSPVANQGYNALTVDTVQHTNHGYHFATPMGNALTGGSASLNVAVNFTLRG